MKVVGPPYISTASFLWKRKSGELAATVVAKTTYRLKPGESQLCDRAEPIVTEDRFADETRDQPLVSGSDLAPFKSGVDVILHGGAYGVGARCVARFVIGTVDKSVEAFGDRTSMRDSQGGGASRMPLIGTGPISPRWPLRRNLWPHAFDPSLARAETDAIVEAIPPAYFNQAPSDQRSANLEEGTELVLMNLNPTHPQLKTVLPRQRLHVSVEGELASEEVALVADTLTIDTDRELVSVVWRATVSPITTRHRRLVVSLEEPDAFGNGTIGEFVDEPTNGPRTHRQRAATLPFKRTTHGFASAPTPNTPAGNGLPWAAQRPQPSPSQPSAVPAPIAQPIAPPMGNPIPPSMSSSMSQGVPQQGLPQSLPSAPPVASSPFQPVAPPAPVPLASLPSFPSNPPLGAISSASIAASGSLGVSRSSIGQSLVEPVRHAEVKGAVAASNAALRAEDSGVKEVSGKRSAGQTPTEILWVSSDAMPRVRIWWKDLIAEKSFEEFDSKHELSTPDPDEDKSRHEVAAIFSREVAQSPVVAMNTLSGAIDAEGRFTHPLELFEGELRHAFSAVARLEVAIALTQPLTATDKRMRELSEAGAAQLELRYPNAGDGALRAFFLMRDHYTQLMKNTAPPLEPEIDRLLTEARAFDAVVVFGQKHLRATLVSGSHAVPVYLPEAIRDKLPLFSAISARLIAEVHTRQESKESSPAALRVVALGRLVNFA